MNIRTLAAVSLLAVPAYVMAADDAEQYSAQDYVNEEIEIVSAGINILEGLTKENVDKMSEDAKALKERMLNLNEKYWKNAKQIAEAQREKKNQERFMELAALFEEVEEKAWQLEEQTDSPKLKKTINTVLGICDAILPRKTQPISSPIGSPAKASE